MNSHREYLVELLYDLFIQTVAWSNHANLHFSPVPRKTSAVKRCDPPMLPIGEWNSVDQDFSHLRDRDELQDAQG